MTENLQPSSKKYPLLGKVVAGRYEVVGFIGHGAMGAVYKAKHNAMGRLFAIKTLNANLLTDERSIRRFEQEAQAMSVLMHPNLIAIADYGRMDDDTPFFVMEYLEGISLASFMKKTGPLPLDVATPIFAQIADALAHAHSKSLVHRDLKPSNVMLIGENQDFVKVVDLGIAKILSDDEEPDQRLTGTGELFGSPLYMSPEQCMGTAMDARSDIYSFGCLMYEALIGRPALKGDNFVQTVYKHMNEAPKPIRELRPDLSEDIAAVVEACLRKQPADRIGSMIELRDKLRNMQSGARVETPTSTPAKPLNFKLIGAAAGLVAVLICASFLLGRSETPKPPDSQPSNITTIANITEPQNVTTVTYDSPRDERLNPRAPEEVDVIAIYAAAAPLDLNNVDEQEPIEVEVSVMPKEQPITLVLLSYMPIHWKVKPQFGARIDRVVASGYCEPRVTSGVSNVTRMCQKTHGFKAVHTANLFYTERSMAEESKDRTYQAISEHVEEMLHKPIKRYVGSFYGSKFEI